MKKKKRKNLKWNLSNYYVGIALFFILGFGFFGTSKIFFAEELPVNQTPLNTVLDLRANGKFTINRWIYDEDKNKMEVILVTNDLKDYTTELDFSSVSRTNVKQPLPTNLVFNDNEIYILHVDQVPKNFAQLAIRLHKSEKNFHDIFNENQEEEENHRVISTIYTDERMVEREEVNVKETREYTRQVADRLIDQSQLKIEEYKNRIEKLDRLYQELNEEKEKEKAGLLYQTMDEQITTNNKIYRLDREMDMNRKEVEKTQGNIKGLNLKIERLNQKKRDIGF